MILQKDAENSVNRMDRIFWQRTSFKENENKNLFRIRKKVETLENLTFKRYIEGKKWRERNCE